jgi:orotate phosphoribosyltransferase
MDALAERSNAAGSARERLIDELREHALVIGEVTLTSGAIAQYYVDAKRAILRPPGFAALASLLAAQVADWQGTAVGGMTMGADPIEGPLLGPEDRCVVVEDVVTTGGSTLAAIAALHDAGREICGVVSVLDRLAGGGAAIEREAGAPYVALSTIDDVYPQRPERAPA